MSSPTSPAPTSGVLSPPWLLTTLGMCAIIGIAAFESLAVTTVMPTVARELDGEHLYSLAFAAPLATGLVGMVVGGTWADRAGPRVVVVTSMLLFAVGLLVVGLAPDMLVLLIGRLVQGAGSGAVIVALYVMVAQVYPPRLHAAVFAGFAAAWVVPSLVGPLLAGWVTQALGWHWVFVGALGLAVPAFLVILPSLRALTVPPPGARPPWARGRIAWSGVAAVAVLVLNLVTELPPLATVVAVLVTGVLLVVALRPLLPAGTLVARPGLPTLVLLRGLLGGAFLGAEAYLPYMLMAEHDLSESAAGVVLTFGAVSWAGGSWLQGRLGEERLSQAAGIRLGVVLVLVGVSTAAVSTALVLHPAVVVAGWVVGGAGMGFTYPRFSVLTLRWAPEAERGFASSSLSIADSTGAAVVLAGTGVAFGLLGGAGEPLAFVAVFAVAVAVALVAVAASGRAVPRELVRA
ncbi:MFS transporter [Frigoribacterium salinisoli]